MDVRVICATHHDLEARVEQGLFRRDLYFRLRGVIIQLPALKDRREDIPELLDYFIERSCRENGFGLKVFEPAARALLIEFDWPGNVRQLSDTVQSLIQLTPGHYITQQDVADHLAYDSQFVSAEERGLNAEVKDFKRLRIVQTLDQCEGNVAAAARDLKIDQANLRKMIQALGITL